MEQIENIEMAVNIVKHGESDTEKTFFVNKLLEDDADTETDEGKALLGRRAFLITELREQQVWEYESGFSIDI